MNDESGTDDLAALAEDFRADIPHVPSTDEILAQAARDARNERLEWAYQIGGPTFAAVALVYTAVQMRSVMFVILAAVAIPTLFALLGFFVHVRREARRSVGASVADHVGALVARRRADLQLVRAARVALALLITAFWIWLPIYVWTKADRFAAEPWKIGISVCVAVLVFVVAWRQMVLQVEKAGLEVERWSAVAGSLADERRG